MKLPKTANIFYELYLADDNGKLANVPILIRNYQNAEGKSTNTGTIISDDWVLMRRFVLQDTISGITVPDGYRNGQVPPSYVRWASKIELKVALDAS